MNTWKFKNILWKFYGTFCDNKSVINITYNYV